MFRYRERKRTGKEREKMNMRFPSGFGWVYIL